MRRVYLDNILPLTELQHDKWPMIWFPDLYTGVRLVQSLTEAILLIALCIILPHLVLRKNPGVALTLWLVGLASGIGLIYLQALVPEISASGYMSLILCVGLTVFIGLTTILIRWHRQLNRIGKR